MRTCTFASLDRHQKYFWKVPKVESYKWGGESDMRQDIAISSSSTHHHIKVHCCFEITTYVTSCTKL